MDGRKSERDRSGVRGGYAGNHNKVGDMSFDMDRVAPEKAVFRPALPASFMPGITEMQMKKPYFEKLLDPRWQKKRLEVLEKNEWACVQCSDTESTLHVHHKQYFKGREPWEYEVGQLTVLCEECHGIQHESEDPLLLVASFVAMDGPYNRDAVANLVAGFCDQDIPQHGCGDPGSFLSGRVAREIEMKLQVWQRAQLHEALSRRDMFTVREAMADFISNLNSRADATPVRTGGMDLDD